MMDNRIRVVVDTNLWISLLIGSKLADLLEVLADPQLELISTELLRKEIFNVTQRPKFRKYFSEEKVEALMVWMDEAMTTVTTAGGRLSHYDIFTVYRRNKAFTINYKTAAHCSAWHKTAWSK